MESAKPLQNKAFLIVHRLNIIEYLMRRFFTTKSLQTAWLLASNDIGFVSNFVDFLTIFSLYDTTALIPKMLKALKNKGFCLLRLSEVAGSRYGVR